MKPSPERLRIETYPFTTIIEPRFGDVDALQHLNNVALAGIYEEGRIRFTNTFRCIPARLDAPTGVDKPADLGGRRTVIAEVAICYLAEGYYPGALTVATGVLRVGRTSYVTGQAIFQTGNCIGTADTVVVFASAGRPYPLPDETRTALEAALIAVPLRLDD